MYTHGCTVHLISLFSVSPTLQSRRVRHHVGCSTNSGKWTGTNIIYKTTRHQTLNILNNCVKVFVVVMRKEKITKTISYLTKKPRRKCHLTESFWELPRCSVCVTTGSWQTQFSQKKKKEGGSSRGSRVVGDGAVRRTMNSTIQHLICPLFLPVSLPLYLFNRLSSPPCLLFRLSAQRMVIFYFFFDTAQLWHRNQHFPPQVHCPQEREGETNRAPGWPEFQKFTQPHMYRRHKLT